MRQVRGERGLQSAVGLAGRIRSHSVRNPHRTVSERSSGGMPPDISELDVVQRFANPSFAGSNPARAFLTLTPSS